MSAKPLEDHIADILDATPAERLYVQSTGLVVKPIWITGPTAPGNLEVLWNATEPAVSICGCGEVAIMPTDRLSEAYWKAVRRRKELDSKEFLDRISAYNAHFGLSIAVEGVTAGKEKP